MFRLLFIAVALSPCVVNSTTLVDFKKGTQVRKEELLSQGRLLVYIEKDCSACAQYVEELKTCAPELQRAIGFVSVNTPAQTKSMARTLPEGMSLYVLKDSKNLKDVPATPTTQGAKGQKVGPLKCEDLSALQK